MRYLRWIFPLLALAGCVSSEQRDAAFSRSIENDFGPACAAKGFEPGTDPYQKCKLSLYQGESASERAARLREKM